ncbi:protein MEI2-like 2 [Andrographis paniculata]|uniref:protein MEI2-like 2 n=1 Tax=Andrographis paniculata TaxID=175694 RepID=UPI0021E84CA3|nr:protein MEI2-like 2 [Andrographis paniculata]XP_051125717.1 protein MEI2-like 2 [Andrographis paniculata]XP_051125718.1 protein MEI2-like 2 [Andrographis paniculata]
MEPSSESFNSGHNKTLFTGTVGKEKTVWGLPGGTNAHRSSSDASLFSTSLPVLSHVKLNFSESDQSGQLRDDGFPSLDRLRIAGDVMDPHDSTEQGAIGNFLPGDEDELLAGLMDDFDLSGLPTQLEDLDDDIFGSGGGMEIELDQENLVNGVSRLGLSDGIGSGSISHYGFVNGAGAISGEHPYGEHPSRTLFVRNINSNVEDSELRSLFEQYGDIRTLYTACKHRGFVMISYYDIRAARTAMRALQNKPLRRRKLDIHFSIPKDNPSEKDINQGTLVVFNLESSVSNDELRQIFGAYGEVKEIRETPHKRHHKFIEFYDVRAAEAALKALNRSDIGGKRIKLEPSRPGGARRSLMLQLTQEQEQDEARTFRQQIGSPIGNSPPGILIDGSWPSYGSPVDQNYLHGYSQAPTLGQLSPVGSNHVPGLASILPSHASSPVKIAPIGKDTARISPVNTDNAVHAAAYQKHFSATDSSKLSSSPGHAAFSDSKASSVGTLSGPQFLWGSPTIHSENINSPSWSSSLKGLPYASRGQGIGFPYNSQHGTFLGPHHHHVGSAPSGIQLERHFGFFPESVESSSYKNQATFGVSNYGPNNGNLAVNMGRPGALKMGVAFAGNFTESGSPNSRMMPMSRNGPMYFGNGSFGIMGDGLIDRSRSRRTDGGSQVDNKKQYQLDLEKIVNGEDIRTTLMIKNIPNKYTSKMLLAAIDETHKGTYDFLYLPIDFKNKCNVGYAFINMVSPAHIITFYEAFNGKKWEKFNSEKVASLAYARIQGKTALISHFQNSSLMNEDKRCRPIVFQSEGQEIGDLDHVPSGNLNVFIRQADGSYAGDSLDSPKGDLDEKL